MENKKTTRNPFVCQGYEGPEYFCDRMTETEELLNHFANGRNVTLVSPRRIGKTGLICHAFHHIREQEKEALCVYLDVFPTKNLTDFTRMFCKAVIDEIISKSQSVKKRVLEFFSSLRPVFSIDPLTGAPTVSVSLEPILAEPTLKSVFDFLKTHGKDVYIAIDEFQQVAEYPESGTEALLRSYIQFANNVRFVFSGSKYHMMTEMFTSSQRPFFQSTEFMNLLPLHEEIYYDFAANLFQQRKGKLDKEVFHQLYQRFDGYTWYMQAVLNRLYEEHVDAIEVSQLNDTLVNVLRSRSVQYEMLLQFLTENQFALLKAIALEGIVAQPTSRDFIRNYNLPGASSVQNALEVLQSKEIIYHKPEGFIVYDRFLDLWLKHVYL